MLAFFSAEWSLCCQIVVAQSPLPADASYQHKDITAASGVGMVGNVATSGVGMVGNAAGAVGGAVSGTPRAGGGAGSWGLPQMGGGNIEGKTVDEVGACQTCSLIAHLTIAALPCC